MENTIECCLFDALSIQDYGVDRKSNLRYSLSQSDLATTEHLFTDYYVNLLWEIAKNPSIRGAWGRAVDDDVAVFFATKKGYLTTARHMKAKSKAMDHDVALCYAAENGQERVMRYLKSVGASGYSPALYHAAKNNQIGAMRLLESWGGNYNTAFCVAASKGDLATILVLNENGIVDYNIAFCVAVENNQDEVARLLLNWGVNFKTALNFAMKNGKYKAEELLKIMLLL